MSKASAADEESAALARTSLFCGLDGVTLAGVAAACRRRMYGRGQVLCSQGDPGTTLFVLASGLVKVIFTSEQGDEMLLATLGRGDMFGEVAVLDGGPRSASVIAVEPTVALTLTRDALIQLMRAHPTVLDGLLTALGTTVRRITEQAGDLAFLRLETRLAKVLARVAEARHLSEGGDVILTQSELAQMAGASRQAVNRALRSLVLKGVIDNDGGRLILHDPAALRSLAGL